MTISATLINRARANDATVETDGNKKRITIPARATGQGSSVNGGELLFLALATCFCNDLYREAVRRNIILKSVQVTVSGNFGKDGEPASNITFTADVESDASEKEIAGLIADVDKVAEVHNTLRKGVSVSLIGYGDD